MRIDDEGSLVRERDRVAVRRRFRTHGGADVALSSAAVVDDHLLARQLGELRAHHARESVSAASWRERHDKTNGPLRILPRGKARRSNEGNRKDQRFQQAFHVAPPQLVVNTS